MNNMRILAICPSIYPVKLAKMLNSFLVTRSKHTDIIINSEIDTITNIFNRVFREHNNYDFYMMLNDDILFETPLWDIALAQKGKIAHGTDSIDSGINGQFMMIDGDVARAVGWLQLPTLNRYGGDVVWRFIGENLNILEYVPEVVITHNWEGADEVINKEDIKRFSEWLPWAFKDCNRIREALCQKNIIQ